MAGTACVKAQSCSPMAGGNGISPAVPQLQRGCMGREMRKVVGHGKRQVHWGYFVKGLVFFTQAVGFQKSVGCS